MTQITDEALKLFVWEAHRYVREYVKVKNPWEEGSRCFKGLGFGHAPDLLSAISVRESLVKNLKEVSQGFQLVDFERARELFLQDFKYDRRFLVPKSYKKEEPGKYITVSNYYDPANVRGLLEEAIKIALGEESAAKPVPDRFEHTQQKSERYMAMLRGDDFTI